MQNRSAARPHLKAIIACVLSVAGSAPALSQAVAALHSEPRSFNIEAQDLGSALKAFAFQSNREIFFAPELTQGKQTHGVVGRYDDLDALKKILANTGLTYSITDSNAILVRDPSNVSSSRPSAFVLGGSAMQLARADVSSAQVAAESASQRSTAAGGGSPAAEQADDPNALYEVIVTATKRP